MIEERGANLSGGQRQRLAIARALATNPRILILDEATSALDYESERIIQSNMERIVRDRTVIIIAHRLAAVRGCDRIIGMINGEITEVGTHDALLTRSDGLYARLWAIQNEHKGAHSNRAGEGVNSDRAGERMNDQRTTAVSAPPKSEPAGGIENHAAAARVGRRPARPVLLVLRTPRLPEREAEDREFLPAALAIVEQPLSPARVAFLYTLCAMLVAAILWACFGRLDVYAVAPGKIEVTGRTKVVEPLQSGKVISIEAKDGEKVKAGDVLVQLNSTEALASQTAAAAALTNARAEIARLKVETAAARATHIDARPQIDWPADIPQDVRQREVEVLNSDLTKLSANLGALDAQRDEKIAERDKYTANIAATKSLITSLSAQLTMTDKMTKEGWSSQSQYLKQLDPVLQAQESEVSLEGELTTATQDIAVVDAQIVQTRQTFLATETSQAATDERNIAQLEQNTRLR